MRALVRVFYINIYAIITRVPTSVKAKSPIFYYNYTAWARVLVRGARNTIYILTLKRGRRVGLETSFLASTIDKR